jgi:hypothetical protein
MRSFPRNRLTRIAISTAVGLLVLVLTPIWAVHHAVSTLRTSRKRGSTAAIPRVSAREVELADVIQRGEPVIIRHLIDDLDLPITPDLDGLRDLAATEAEPFRVRIHKSHSPYFLYTGDYGAELDHVEKMTLADFLDFMFEAGPEPGTCSYRLFSVADLDGAIGTIIDDIGARLAARADRRPDRHASGIWIGSEGVVTPLHHDAWTGLLFQMTGAKRILMFAPTERPNLSFLPPFAVGDRWSRLPGRADDADPAAHPRFARADRHEATLEEGEVLFIPPFWSHEIEALEANISIPFRFRTRPVEIVNPGFLRAAYEVFHHRVLEDRSPN